jgi:SAM-dependent methyltransferase
MKDKDLAKFFFPEVGAGGFSRVDSTVQFYERVNALVNSESVVLDFGAGRGRFHLDDVVHYRRKLRHFKGSVREVIGADVDPIVATNPSLDRALVLDPCGSIPLPTQSVDLIVSDFTFEHLQDPALIANELDRVLVPGGWICARTPNRYGYVALANQLVPEIFRMRVLRLVQPGKHEKDTFKTFYRLNTCGALRRYFQPAQYDHFTYSWDAEPAYHGNSKILYWIFLMLHLLTPRPLRTLLLIFLQKKQ